MARLKTFITSDGLTDYVVAATSRPKALAAWGVRQDLFKEGRAHEVDDVALRAAAEKAPGVVLERAAGGRETLSRMKAPPAKGRTRPGAAARRKIEDLERDLERLEDELAESLAGIDADIAALEARRASTEDAVRERRARLERRLAAARRAL